MHKHVTYYLILQNDLVHISLIQKEHFSSWDIFIFNLLDLSS